ncbi:sepiapterin reductase a [Anguilla anguilla]|uniref:sepiapterin reductase a n=1 Tax=Anguilla anguilla TaxID=7936 RepID=UPI0015AA88A2|nr:sepiapterin reductase a [Anguilla anguilla]
MESHGISHPIDPSSKGLGRALCVITGASKGFGRCLAKQIAGLVKPGSVLLLVARSGDKLKELQAELAASDAGKKGLVIRCVTADLAQKGAVEETVKAAKQTSHLDIDRLLLINNAASLGDVSRFAVSFTDPEEINSYLAFNVSSALSLTAALLDAFPKRSGLQRCVVNVSSLCALQPFPSWVLYCTGKAARDMMFRVLAEEEPELRVLNYAPGPLDTDMHAEARTKSGDGALQSSLTAMHAEGRVLTCQESGAKLLKLLLEDDFTSGTHIDVYDV